MRWHCVAACVAAVGLLSGCAGPRVVRSDQTGGVVAIPANSNSWPGYYRTKAEELIRQRCPNGYEIVSEQEVVTGQTAHTNVQTDTQEAPALVFGGKDSSEKTDKKGGKSKESTFAGLAVPVGETRQTTNQTTTYHDITEYRIEYRAK
ncbi:hypothetical protein [Gemmata sp.]|uniref:hypothetical protein n=1 Tax=Gemmata sp. TaxID=1914242 RepID=UPI003F6F16D8